jgi:hypothetical protein
LRVTSFLLKKRILDVKIALKKWGKVGGSFSVSFLVSGLIFPYLASTNSYVSPSAL